MNKSRGELRKFLDQAIRLSPKGRPRPMYQRFVFWIIILGTLLLVLDVVFFR
jgi:hypothetical protein